MIASENSYCRSVKQVMQHAVVNMDLAMRNIEIRKNVSVNLNSKIGWSKSIYRKTFSY